MTKLFLLLFNALIMTSTALADSTTVCGRFYSGAVISEDPRSMVYNLLVPRSPQELSKLDPKLRRLLTNTHFTLVVKDPMVSAPLDRGQIALTQVLDSCKQNENYCVYGETVQYDGKLYLVVKHIGEMRQP